RVLQELTELAHLAVGRDVDPHHVHLAGYMLAVELVAEHRRDKRRGGHPLYHVARHLADLVHVALGVGHPFEATMLDHDVREDVVQPLLHLVGKAAHHGVHHNHGRHAERHADDRGEGDVPRTEIPPAQEVLIHGLPWHARWET